MELLSVKCPSCASTTAVDPSRAQAPCQYCGMILSIAKPQLEEEAADTFMNLSQVEQQYFNDEIQADDVLTAYAEIEVAEEANANYWLARARFFAKGVLKEFEAGRVSKERRSEIVEQYVFWMDQAIANYAGIAFELKVEKEKTIGDINNAFGVPKRREVAEEETDSYRQVVSMDEDELDDDELEDATAAKKKKRNIIIAAIGGVLLLLLGLLLLRSCGNHNDDDQVEYYEAFLELSYMLELFNDDARASILDLNIDFGEQNADAATLRVAAPATANLDMITFHFDEEDQLSQLSVTSATYFNGFAASEGFATNLTQHLVTNFAEEFELDNDILSFITDEFAVVITLRSERFNISIVRADDEDGLTPEQQETWDLIESRIRAGYNSWADLVDWAAGQDIAFSVGDAGERPIDAILLLINEYGVLGNYTHATPEIGWTDDPHEVVLVLHFDGLTYNDAVAELSSLNQNSNRELDSWLDSNGLSRLESHFAEVEIVNFEYEGGLMTGMPEVVEFVNWEIVFFDRFMPEGQGQMRIMRVYRILEIEEETEETEETEEDQETEETEEPIPSGPRTLSSGEVWVVGEDILQMRYTITAEGGSGDFLVRRGDALVLNEIIGSAGVSSVTTYLVNGDVIEISGANARLNPVSGRNLSRNLGAGHWIVGTDIEAGDFEATAPSGSGSLIVFRGGNPVTNVMLDGNTSASVNLVNGDIVSISGLDRVNFE